jgi:membrane-associated phospholipid phosphatase
VFFVPSTRTTATVPRAARAARAERAARAARAVEDRLAWRRIAFLAVLTAFVLVTLGVIYRSPVLHLDHEVAALRLRSKWPQGFGFVHTYVMLGQRGPSTLALLPWFAWRAWRERSSRPIVTLVVALLVLNISVGVVKIVTGRLGPRATPWVHAVFAGGNIYPSGHVSNAVVLYGVVALLSVKHRKALIAATAFISVTVGIGTVYLRTHWFSDVVGGWLAGVLVLLVLPSLVPPVERAVGAGWQAAQRRRALRAKVSRRSTGGLRDTAPVGSLPAQLIPA